MLSAVWDLRLAGAEYVLVFENQRINRDCRQKLRSCDIEFVGLLGQLC